MNSDDINDLIDECIDALCDENAEYGADSLAELATLWARAGLTQRSFADVRQYVKNSAKERLGASSAYFIEYKLQKAEKKLQNKRYTSGAHNGHIIIN